MPRLAQCSRQLPYHLREKYIDIARKHRPYLSEKMVAGAQRQKWFCPMDPVELGDPILGRERAGRLPSNRTGWASPRAFSKSSVAARSEEHRSFEMKPSTRRKPFARHEASRSEVSADGSPKSIEDKPCHRRRIGQGSPSLLE